MQLELSSDALRARLASRELGGNFHYLQQTDSTMNEAARLSAMGAPHGTLVVAEEQSAGRGRRGNEWISEPSVGLYFTLLMRPAMAPAAAPVMTLMTGVAVAEAIQSVAGTSVDIRWPNDILCREKKCAGILVEMSADHNRIEHVLIGVGVNVNHLALPGGLRTEATSLRLEAGREIDRADLLVTIVDRLQCNWERLLTGGSAAIVARFTELSSYASGKRVQVLESADGLRGVTAGLTPDGVLLVRRDDGRMERVLSGHVRPE